MSTAQTSNGILTAQSGIGAVRAGAWLNTSAEGESRGVSVTLSKSYYHNGAFHKTKCSLKATEVSAAIAVLQDIERQLIAQSRDINKSHSSTSEPADDGHADEF